LSKQRSYTLIAIGEAEWAEISEIAKSTLANGEHTETGYVDSAWSDAADDETAAKQMALKIYVNRCRRDKEDVESAKDAITVLTEILQNDGETITGDSSGSSSSIQRNHLRLTAARGILKLCRYRNRYEQMVTPQMFHTVAWVLVSPPYGVRGGLVRQLKKYLSTDQLSSRWLTLLFLLPFEPDEHLRVTTMAWLKSRLAHYTRQQSNARTNGERKVSNTNIMESTFSRLLSLLAFHPDFPANTSPEYVGELFDFANYIIFYLRSVSTEENLSLIFHIAQRVKQASDAVMQPKFREDLRHGF
jgi:sister chromatid cohesion protein PDS5